MLFEKKHFRF